MYARALRHTHEQVKAGVPFREAYRQAARIVSPYLARGIRDDRSMYCPPPGCAPSFRIAHNPALTSILSAHPGR